MNKLNVALKLIQLLNERKFINSQIIARELNVSIRTAQRYLTDLSFMPCVMNLGNNHTYALNPEYKIKDVITNNGNQYDINVSNTASNDIRYIKQSLCIICSSNRNYNYDKINKNNNGIKNKYEIDKLINIINKRLSEKKCSFP